MNESRHELARKVRRLMRGSRSAALSTGLVSFDAWPYGSMVTVAMDQGAAPLLLMSTLSDHTRNLLTDNRAALLFSGATRYRNPQRVARVTVLGRICKTKKSKHAARFLSMHPEARAYSNFGDFDFYRMHIERAHWIGGFAQAHWLGGKIIAVKSSTVGALTATESSICQHMNEDHGDALDLCVQQLLKRRGKGWEMIGIDADGADLARDARFARLNFPYEIASSLEARETLVNLVAEARNVKKLDKMSG